MSEQGWLKREMEVVQCEVATWPAWKRGEGMKDAKRYKLCQDVCYDDGAFVIPAGQVMVREADYDALRDERDRLAELVRQAQPHVCSLLCPSVKARHELWTHTKLCLNMQAALTPAGQRWTRERPTAPGVYWFRWDKDRDAIIVMVLTEDCDWRVLEMGNQYSGAFAGYASGEFQGPLTPNEETE